MGIARNLKLNVIHHLDTEYFYQPYEPPTEVTPGVEEGFIIESVSFNGRDVTDELTEDFLRRLEAFANNNNPYAE